MMPDFPLEETEPNWNKMTCPSLHSQQMVEKPSRNREVSSVSCSFHSHEGLGNPKHIALTCVQGSNNNLSGHKAGVSYWDFIGRCIDILANNCRTRGIQIGHHSHFLPSSDWALVPPPKGSHQKPCWWDWWSDLSFFLKELLQSALSVRISIAALPTGVHPRTIYNS